MTTRPLLRSAFLLPSRFHFLLLLVGGGACGADRTAPPEPMWSGPQPPGERTFLERDRVEAWVVGGPGDPLLAQPRHLTALDSAVVWWDDYDHAVLAVSRDGELLWRFGREGEGPGEFLDVGDVAVTADGILLVLDSDLGLITRLSPDGRLLGQQRLPEGYWRSLAPQPDGSVVLAGVDAAHPFVRVDSTGVALERLEAPWTGFGRLSLIQRQGAIVAHGDGRWAYAFLIGNGWMPFRASEPLAYLGRSIEHTDFPEMIVVGNRNERISRLTTRPNCSVCSGWLTGDTLAVLFGGADTTANRVVDRYAWSDGRYLDSVLLPAPALDVAELEGLLVVLEDGLEPRIVGYVPAADAEADASG